MSLRSRRWFEEALERFTPSKRSEEEQTLRSFSSKRSEEGHLLRSLRSERSCGKPAMVRKGFHADHEWVCPVCNHREDLTGCRPRAASRIQKHIMYLHNAVWHQKMRDNSWRKGATTGMGLRMLAEPIRFEKMKKEELTEKASFLCP